MAAVANSRADEVRRGGLRKVGTQRSKIGSDDVSHHRKSIGSRSGSYNATGWSISDLQDAVTGLIAAKQSFSRLNLKPLSPWASGSLPTGVAPPSYDEAVSDTPPDYTSTDALAIVQSLAHKDAPATQGERDCKRSSPCALPPPAYAEIDFSSSEHFRTHAKKKAKKGTAFNWDDDGEKKNEEGPDGNGEPNGDGAAGDGGSGAGGAGDGGDGGKGNDDGDDWNDWSTGKNKKKGKKGKEEEDKKKREEEEAAAAAEAAKDAGDADPMDEWGGWGTAKNKKKTTNTKADSAPAAKEESTFHDISLGDDAPKLSFDFDAGDKKSSTLDLGPSWGGWGNTGSKWSFGGLSETKKEEPVADVWGSFAKKDDKKPDKKKDASGDMGFDFGFNSSADAGNGDITGEKKADEDDMWSSFTTTGKKSKKKGLVEDVSKPSAAATGEAEPTEDVWGGWGGAKKDDKKKDAKKNAFAAVPIEEEKPEEKEADDIWGSWGAIGSKTKKKTGIEEVTPEPKKAATIEEDPNVIPWDEWQLMNQKDRKKALKQGKIEPTQPQERPLEDEIEDAPGMFVDAPLDEVDPNVIPWEEWEFMNAKQRKKALKDGKKEPSPPDEKLVDPEPDIDASANLLVDETDPNVIPWDEWILMSKKDQKKAVKNGKVEPTPPDDKHAEPQPDPEPAADPAEETKDPNEVPWDEWQFMSPKELKKAEKAGKYCGPEPKPAAEETEAIADGAAVEEKDPNEVPWDEWHAMSAKDQKKAQRSGKYCAPEVEPPVEDDPPDPIAAKDPNEVPWDEWQFMTPKDKKKAERAGKHCGPEPEAQVDDIAPEPAEEKDPNEVPWDEWQVMSSKDKKKAEKSGKYCGPEPEAAVADADADATLDDVALDTLEEKDPNEIPWDEWQAMSSKDQKKAQKSGKYPAVEPAPPPAAKAELPNGEAKDPDEIDWDTWNFMTSKEKRKALKDGKKEPQPPSKKKDVLPDLSAFEPAKDPTDDWTDVWGATSTKKSTALTKTKTTEPNTTDEWGTSWSNADKKKDAASNADSWGTSTFGSFWGGSKEKKKSDPLDDLLNDNVMKADEVEEPKDAGDDAFMGFTTTSNAKSKDRKSKKKGAVEVISEEATVKPDSIVEDKSDLQDEGFLGIWGSNKSKSKKKNGITVSGLDSSGAPSPPGEMNTISPPPKAIKAAEDDPWAALKSSSSSKKDKSGKLSKSATKDDTLSKSTSKDSKSGKTAAEDLLDLLDDPLPDAAKDAEDVAPAAAARSIWSTWGAPSKTEPKKEEIKKPLTPRERMKAEKERKEKEKREKEEADEAERLEKEAAAEAELVRLAEEEKAKAEKAKKPKTKAELKAEEKAAKKKGKKDPEPEPEPASAVVPDTEADAFSWGDDFGKKDEKKEDDTPSWGIWGVNLKSTKKTGARTEKETPPAANQRGAITDEKPKAPEPSKADEDTSPLESSKANSKTKSSTKSSVAEKIRALEAEKKLKKKTVVEEAQPPPPPPPPVEPVIPDIPDPKKSSSSSKKISKSSSKSKKPEPEPELAVPEPPPKSTSPLPGLFPEDEEDYFGASPNPPAMGKTAATVRKSDKKPSTKKASKPATPAVDPAEGSSTAVNSTAKPPPPSPESDEKADATSAKKERAKVVRNGSTSWGLWGTSGKKTSPAATRPKESPSEDSPVIVPPAYTRPKKSSKEAEKDVERASTGSDKEKADKPVKSAMASRPKSSRANTGFSFFNPPPVARSKSMREKQASEDRDVLTPPTEDDAPKMSSKAAKMMGVDAKRPVMASRLSTKNRRKSAPDPYAISSDDAGLADDLVDDAPAPAVQPVERSSRKKSKRDSVMPPADDLIDLDNADGPAANLAFDTPSRPPLKRSATTKAKASGGFMSLFGSAKKDSKGAETARSGSAGYESEGGTSRRKAKTSEDEAAARRVRREKTRSSRRNPAGDEPAVIDGAGATTDVDAEAEARRAERRARRAERDRKDREEFEAKKLQAKEARDREAREEEEREIRRKEENEARRAARAERRATEERAVQEEDARRAEKETRRREREAQRDKERVERPRTERRSSQIPETEEERRERKRSQRKSVPADTSVNRPYLQKGSDKTSSWVQQLNSEPPPPPPVEGTVLEQAPDLTNGDDGPRNVEEEERIYREMRRKSRPKDETKRRDSGYRERDRDDRRRERRTREPRDAREEKESSGGSRGEDRRRSVAYGPSYTLPERPAAAPRRQSLFQKLGF